MLFSGEDNLSVRPREALSHYENILATKTIMSNDSNREHTSSNLSARPVSVMNFNTWQSIRYSLLLFVAWQASACGLIFVAVDTTANVVGASVAAVSTHENQDPPPNRFEPEEVASDEKTIVIKYRSVGPNVEHDRVVEMIAEHCDGPYTESSRKNISGWLTVEAECGGL